QVAEAIGVVAFQLRPVRTQELLAHQRGQARADLGLLRRERLNSAAMEDAALDRSSLQYGSLVWVELIKPGSEERVDRRRHRDVALRRVAQERDHLLNEEWVAFRRPPNSSFQRFRARGIRGEMLDQLVDLVTGEGVDDDGCRVQLAPAPARIPLQQLRPREAAQQEARFTRQNRDLLNQIEKSRLAPLDVIEDADKRKLVGGR